MCPSKHVPRSRDFDQKKLGSRSRKKKRGGEAFLSVASSDAVRLQKVMGSFLGDL